MHIHDEDNDDKPVGRVLSRREILKALAGAGAAILVGYGAKQSGASGLPGSPGATATAAHPPVLNRVAMPGCIVRPEQTEGPYFVDEKLNRSDIRIDTATGQASEGAQLDLNFIVSQINGGCAAYPNVMVDVWQCDALGVYSDVAGLEGHDFLRGFQMTDANGMASFITIYPGWYVGRTAHIHFKIRTDPNDPGGYDFTAQLYFDDTLTDKVYLNPPYNTRGPRSTRNEQDGIYQQGGSQLMLTCVPNGTGGYVATFDIGLAVSSTPTPVATATATGTAVAATATPASTQTATPNSTNTAQPSATNTANPSATNTAQPTSTATTTPGATATPCEISFTDVNPTDYFYEAVSYLSCNNVINGYPDGTFRPYTNASRGQFMKMIVLSQGWALHNPGTPTFSDVPYGSTFYQYIETAVKWGVINGYPDGTFRSGKEVTRAQVCKIVALAMGWTLVNPAMPTFSDVPYGSTFYQYIETAVQQGVVTGYANGTFGPQNSAFRGQIAKIIYLALQTARRLR